MYTLASLQQPYSLSFFYLHYLTLAISWIQYMKKMCLREHGLSIVTRLSIKPLNSILWNESLMLTFGIGAQ